MLIEQFFSYIMARTSCISMRCNDVHFVLDQHTELAFYSASSQKQQSEHSLHIAPLGVLDTLL